LVEDAEVHAESMAEPSAARARRYDPRVMAELEPAAAFDGARFRQVLGHFPTGVVVIAAMAADGRPAGLAVGSFCSVSLDPPLVLFCASRTSLTFPAIRDAGVFAVNVLGEDQEEISRVFASKSPDKFQGLGWTPGATGSPVIHDAVAWIECRVERIDDAGDHYVVLGHVLDLGVGVDRGGPLLFYRGGYGRFAV
jgi:flavin reductase (DIM6/NTAB) family NADH-FMN oxidoreductase RutF